MNKSGTVLGIIFFASTVLGLCGCSSLPNSSSHTNPVVGAWLVVLETMASAGIARRREKSSAPVRRASRVLQKKRHHSAGQISAARSRDVCPCPYASPPDANGRYPAAEMQVTEASRQRR